MKQVWYKYRKFLIAPVITTLILLINYAIKGIYPFGKITIANGDKGQNYIPNYHYLYDLLYHGKNVFFDYTLGMGYYRYGGIIVGSLLSPSLVLVLLSARENIPYMTSFILILRVAFIAITSFILFDKLYKKNCFYNIMFSVLYALSGYVLCYNTNLMWLDVVGVFPLFILSIKYMFETNRIYWFGILLTLMLLWDYQLAYMVLMFIIFVLPIYIHFGLSKEKRKKAVFDVIMGTLLSVGLSAFAFIPAFSQAMQSYRLSGSMTNQPSNENLIYKIVQFTFYSIPLYGFIKWYCYRKQDGKNILMYSLALLFSAVIPIFFERVNLLWHTGSYQCFPFRYGFIPLLILYLGALRYFSQYAKEEKEGKLHTDLILFCIFSAGMIGILNAILINTNLPAFYLSNASFLFILAICLFMIASLENAMKSKQERTKKVICSAIVLLEVMIYTYAYVGVNPQYRCGREWSDEQIFTSYEIANSLPIEKSLYRMKDLTALTTENCALVHNIPTMSCFTLNHAQQVLNCEQLGYSHSNSKLNDYGGTIFSDAIYNIKYVLTKEELSDKIYQFKATTSEGIKLYEYKNTLPIGIVYQKEVSKIPEDLTAFDAQNYLYQNLFQQTGNIIEKVNYEETLKIEGNKELYLYTNQTQIHKIWINGQELILPIFNDVNNTAYPTSYNNGILDLGTYENETVEIKLETNHQVADVQLGFLDIEKYNQIFEKSKHALAVKVEGDKIKITGNSPQDTNLFLPINYDAGWHVTANTKQTTQISKVYNNFLGLTIQQGENEIELQFRPVLWNKCVKLTIITIIVMVICYFVRKRFDIRNVNWLMNLFWILGILIYIGCLIKGYALNIIQTFIS